MNVIKSISIALFFILIIGCDEVEDIINQEVTVNSSFVVDIPITVVESNDPNFPDFGRGVSYDVLSNPDVVELVGTPDRIKKIVINSVRYEYRNFTGNVDTDINGQFVFSTGANSGEAFPTPLVNVAQADLLGDIFTLSGNFEAVSETATNQKKVDFSYAGFASDNPASFIVQVIISADITVELDPSDLDI